MYEAEQSDSATGKTDVDQEDDRNTRSVFLNGFSSGSIMELEIADYFAVLFDGHVRSVWIDRKFGTHSLVEFDDQQLAARAIEMRKHYIGSDRSVVFAWKCSKGKFSKRSRKRQRDNSWESTSVDRASAASDSGISSFDGEGAGFARNIEMLDPINIFDSLKISEEQHSQREALRNYVESGLLDIGIWPKNLKVVLFGSSVSGFGWRSSDIDLTLMIGSDTTSGIASRCDQAADYLPIPSTGEDIDSDPKRLTVDEFHKLANRARLEILCSCLREIEPGCISNIVQIDGRRCPLIQFTYRNNQTAYLCEISVENHHAINNTLWLRRLSAKWKWMPILYSLFRWWLERRNDGKMSRGSTLNGYTLLLIVVAFCQERRLIDRNYQNDPDVPEGPSDQHDRFLSSESIMELFNDLIKYLASARLKQIVFTPGLHSGDESTVSVVKFLTSGRYNENFRFSSLNVQDPFDRSHNTACNVSDANVRNLKVLSRIWMREIEQSAKDHAWKPFSKWQRGPILNVEVDTNEASPTFVCEPSAEALKMLLSGNDDIDKIGRNWCNAGVKAISNIFSDVLAIRIAEEENSTVDEKHFHCLAWNATWIVEKRKAAMQKLIEEKDFGIGVRNRYHIEKRISELVIAEDSRHGKKKKKAQIEPIAEFSLVMQLTCQKECQEITWRLSGEKHAGVFVKFLSSFVDLVFDDAVRKAMLME